MISSEFGEFMPVPEDSYLWLFFYTMKNENFTETFRFLKPS